MSPNALLFRSQQHTQSTTYTTEKRLPISLTQGIQARFKLPFAALKSRGACDVRNIDVPKGIYLHEKQRLGLRSLCEVSECALDTRSKLRDMTERMVTHLAQSGLQIALFSESR